MIELKPATPVDAAELTDVQTRTFDEDTRAHGQGELCCAKTIRIPIAVQPFMMHPTPMANATEARDCFKKLHSNLSMLLYFMPLFIGKRPRLLKNIHMNRQFANVVQEACDVDC